jgi:hypothetical protein
MGLFSRKVQVKLVDDRSGAVVAKTKAAPESLPESFFAHTTMHLGDTDWAIISAEPMTRGEYGKTGRLVIRMRPVETMGASEILYSLPTICDCLPPAEGVAADGTEVVLHEDDWRQCELVSESLRPLVERELAAVKAIHEHERVGPGFRKIHPRQLISLPIVDDTVLLTDLEPLVGTRRRRTVRFAGMGNRVSDLFAIELDDSHLLYVLHEGPVVQVIGFQPTLGPVTPTLGAFAARFGLFAVDWCRGVATPAEAQVS